VTIPGTGDPSWDNVALLLTGEGVGSTFTDLSSTPKSVTSFGNATQTSQQTRWFNGKSIKLDGSGDYLRVADSSAFALGSSDFCIDFWMYASAQAFAPIVHHVSLTNSLGWSLWNYDLAEINLVTRKIGFSVRGGVDLYSPGDAYADNTWTHIAVSRSGDSLNLYSNGIRLAKRTITGSIGKASNSVGVGWLSEADWSSGTASYFYNGYIDDLRITVGSARGFTGATATVPTAEPLKSLPQTVPVTTGGGGGSGLTWSSVPASATATGAAGQIAYDGSWLYLASGTNTWTRFAASGGPWPSYLMSQAGLTSPVAAYSMRRLSASYSGACLRVQRSTDSTQSDIYFSGDWVDTSALYSFVGSGTGYVVKWYDQSGNGNHAGDTTYSNASDFRPRVVNAGAAITLGGRPAIDFTDVPSPNAAGRGLECRGLSISSSNWMAVGVFNYASSTASNNPFQYGRWVSVGTAATADYDNGSSMCVIVGTAGNSEYPNTFNAIQNMVRNPVSIAAGNRYVACAYKSGSSIYARVNNTTSSAASVTATLSASVLRIGLTMNWGSSDRSVLGGQVQETVFYATDASSVVSNAVANVNSSFSVF
jgi:hypothetical protein